MKRSLALFIVFNTLSSLFLNSTPLKNTTGNNYIIHTLKDLPENDVNCIFKDSKGFMWIGTLDGLHRYDGYTYKTYRVKESNNSISSNMIIAIDEDSNGNIWVGTYGKGICKLDPITDTFTNFYNQESYITFNISTDIVDMIVDSNDYIWFCNWFGYTRIKLNQEKNAIVESITLHIESLPNTIKYESPKTIFQDQKGQIWLGSNHKTRLIKNPYDPKNKLKFDTYDIGAETIDDYNKGLILGGEGIATLSPTLTSSTDYELKSVSKENSGTIYCHQNKIWSGSRTGLKCFEKDSLNNWVMTKKYNSDFTKNRINSNIITCITTDINNNIWVGSRGGGVNIINLKPKNFTHFYQTRNEGSIDRNLIKCLFEDSQNNLWIGKEENGVSVLTNTDKYNYERGFKHLPVNDYMNQSCVYAIEEMATPDSKKHQSLIWMGTCYPTYLTAYDPVTLKAIDQSKFSKRLEFVFALKSTNDTTLWVGTYGKGIWRLTTDFEGNIIRMTQFTPKSNSDSPISSNIIRYIFKDSKENLWIGTDKGLNKLPKEEQVKTSPKFTVFKKGTTKQDLSHDYILQITETKDGTIWFGTMGGGLLKYNEDPTQYDWTFTSITTKDGLPNNSIKSIVEDEEGNLWLASNNGLSNYNPISGKIINYDAKDGLQHNEFSEICATKRSNGELIFGGINGFNVFKPEEILPDSIPPKIFLTDFYIFNNEVLPGDTLDNHIVLTKSIEQTDHIELQYSQNSFSFRFVGLHYTTPQKNNYLYQLEGFDKKWYTASPNYRIANYTNIPPGDYTFKVKGSNCDKVWNETVTKVTIKVLRPIYLSNLAIILYLILLSVIIYLIIRNSKAMAKRKNDILIANLETKKEEELSKFRLQFFTNISHEFKTPLTLINAPLDKLMNNNLRLNLKERAYYQQLIKRNVNLMMRLVNQVLDFRKLEQDNIKIKAEEVNLNLFLKSIYQSFTPLTEQKEINFTYTTNLEQESAWIDPNIFDKVIYNLISNAIKFSESKGNITLCCELNKSDKQFIISVSHNGLGIPKGEEEKIFERYYQSSTIEKDQLGGTGIGLALSKGIVELHKGKIWLDNTIDKQTTFFVTIAIGKDHYEPSELANESTPGYLYSQEIIEEIPEKEISIDITTKNQSILIVEDDLELKQHLIELFDHDFIIYEATDGSIAYQICREKMPNIVISDILISKINGLALCKQIKENEATAHIPVLLLTANSTEESKNEGFNAGADSYLAKPFNIEVLKARVKSLIENRKQLRDTYQKEIQINPEINSNTPADKKFLDKILSIIEDELSNSEFTVENLADLYGVSRVYLNRKIKAITGETSNQFLRNIRLKRAAELLKQNTLTVAEVTWKVGYNDLRTFRSRFKEVYGISPSEYAKQNKKNN